MTRHSFTVIFISLSLIMLLVAPATAMAQAGNVVVVDTGAANIRSGPAANTTSLGTVPGGTELPVNGRTEGSTWWRVVSPYGTGWISDEIVVFRGNVDSVPIVDTPAGTLETPTVIVDAYPVTIYRNPNTDSFVLGISPAGAVLTVTGRTADGKWWQLATSIGTGYAMSSKVAFRGDVSLVPVVGDPGPSFNGPTIRVNSEVAVSSEPGGGTTLGTILPGMALPASGRNADNSWWQVAGDFGVGWIPVRDVSLAGAASNIPLVSSTMTQGPGLTGAAAATLVVEADRKVAYDQPSFASAPMWDARLGEQGKVIARTLDGLWLQVTFRNYMGWMHFSGITLQGGMANIPAVDTSPPPVDNIAIVNTAWLNIRSGPGIEYARVGAAAGGDSLMVTGRHPNLPWLRVEGDFGVGWVRIMYIIFRGNWTAVPRVTEPVGNIELPITVVSINWPVYSQPDKAYPAGTVEPGEYVIVGRTANYTWAQIQTPHGLFWMPYDELVLRGIEALIPVIG